MLDAVAVSQSPFTMQSQVLIWPGCDLWTCNFSLPAMAPAVAQVWQGWAGSLRGKVGQFQIGDPMRKTPLGSPSGSPVVSSALVGASVIATTGWTANATNLLLVGDYLQIGYRLHLVCGSSAGGAVNADASGHASIEIWPSIRDLISTSTAIVTSNCTGLFMLSENARSWSVDARHRLLAMSFKCMEAR